MNTQGDSAPDRNPGTNTVGHLDEAKTEPSTLNLKPATGQKPGGQNGGQPTPRPGCPASGCGRCPRAAEPVIPQRQRLGLVLNPETAALIQAGLEGIAAAYRFIPERDAREMKIRSGDVLRRDLPDLDVKMITNFGTGEAEPILTVAGFRALRYTPPTPVSGHGDDCLVAVADLLLLGIYDLMGVEPVAYSFENYGRLFRNVVPAAAGQLSSHGYDRELPFHIDNPCGWLEGAEPAIVDGVTGKLSPVPHYLGFVGLRNQDAMGRPVATEDLPFVPVLAQLEEDVRKTLEQPEFRIEPPASNDTCALVGVPLVVRKGRQTLVRYSGGGDAVSGLTNKARAALVRLNEAVEASAHLAEVVAVEPGMIHVFDNYRVAHRRPSFDPGELKTARWLRRCYAATALAHGRFLDRVHRPNEWT